MTIQYIINSNFVSQNGNAYRNGQYLTLFEYKELAISELIFVDKVKDYSFEGLGY